MSAPTILVLAEQLEEASHTARFTLDTLRGTMKHASATEALVLLPLIGRAADVLREINALRDARASDERVTA